MRTKRFFSIESNTLTYLVEAFDRSYRPETDSAPNLAPERLALRRLYHYLDEGFEFWLPPRAYSEVERISEKRPQAFRDHLSTIVVTCSEGGIEGMEDQVAERANRLGGAHSGASDCRILAESEARGCEALLTCDGDFITRLNPKSDVSILRPSEYWSSLGIPEDARPLRMRTYPDGPAENRWWTL
jgi:predicted nucleic acid-binding protein